VIASTLNSVLEPSGTAVWFWVLAFIAFVWLRRHRDLNRGRDEPVLSAQDVPPPDDPLPRLSVLVAAKDEEANIERCLNGLLAQQYPDFEIIVANDRSADRTGEIVDRLAAQHPHLKTVHITELAPGWSGKNHALHHAVQHATGEYFVFTDADCRFHDPTLLAAAVGYARREQIDFLSVLPQLEAWTFWERVVQPPAGAILIFWFPPQKVNDPRSPRAYANGAFMLMSRTAYERLGGHAAVRTALNEDMHFARRAKQLGVRLRVIRGGGMYSVRMYAGWRQIWNGWTRIFYCCFGTLPRLLASVLFLSVFSLLPTLSLLAALTLLIWPEFRPWAAAVAAVAAVAVLAQQSVLWRFYALGGTRRAWALTWPLGAAACLGITLNAIARHFGARTHWRGTTYTAGA
jgi:chlorobactene glucosyltransferase